MAERLRAMGARWAWAACSGSALVGSALWLWPGAGAPPLPRARPLPTAEAPQRRRGLGDRRGRRRHRREPSLDRRSRRHGRAAPGPHPGGPEPDRLLSRPRRAQGPDRRVCAASSSGGSTAVPDRRTPDSGDLRAGHPRRAAAVARRGQRRHRGRQPDHHARAAAAGRLRAAVPHRRARDPGDRPGGAAARDAGGPVRARRS